MGEGLDIQGYEQWRCAYCREPIGAYEPMVTVEDGQARRTSRTAEIRAGRFASEPYHQACHVLKAGEALRT
jgi:hypothetical protein